MLLVLLLVLVLGAAAGWAVVVVVAGVVVGYPPYDFTNMAESVRTFEDGAMVFVVNPASFCRQKHMLHKSRRKACVFLVEGQNYLIRIGKDLMVQETKSFL